MAPAACLSRVSVGGRSGRAVAAAERRHQRAYRPAAGRHHPLAVGLYRLVLALEVRRDVAGEQLVAAHHAVPVHHAEHSPEEATEATGVLQQRLDVLDRVLYGADYGAAAFD